MRVLVKKVNALFIIENGVYYLDNRIIPWSIKENAFNCDNELKSICHPPCKRWGRYWSGGPSSKVKKNKGDDNGAFAFCLYRVRTFGGIIEHPEASHAWQWFGLKKPPKSGGWVVADNYGGMTCCVEQGNYGHKARKATWLYGKNIKFPQLKWGRSDASMKFEMSPRSKSQAREMRAHADYKPIKRLTENERLGTPKEFKELLIDMVYGDY